MSYETQFTLFNVRASFVFIAAQRVDENGQPKKYSMKVLIPKSDTASVTTVDAAIQQAFQQGLAEKWNNATPPGMTVAYYDGDAPGRRPEEAGHMVLSTSSLRKPGVYNEQVQPVIDPEFIYSGCWVNVQLNAYPFKKAGNTGISFGLNMVQKARDGEPLGTQVDPNSVFQPVGGAAAAAAFPVAGAAFGGQTQQAPAAYAQAPAQAMPGMTTSYPMPSNTAPVAPQVQTSANGMPSQVGGTAAPSSASPTMPVAPVITPAPSIPMPTGAAPLETPQG